MSSKNRPHGKLVEKVTIIVRRCWVCLRLWPAGTHFFAPLGSTEFKCPDNRHYNSNPDTDRY